MNFIQALLAQLHEFIPESSWVAEDDLLGFLQEAAAASLPEELPAITLRREIDPEEMRVHTVLNVDGEQITMYAEDVATLRALLLSWDETRPPQLGEPLAVPTRLKGGKVVSVVTEELLREE